jgi:predicted nucleic acid-binding protein
VLLDTNILLSALLVRGTPPDHIYEAWRQGRFELVSCERQVQEINRVSRRPALRQRLRPAEAGRLVNEIRRLALLVEPARPLDLEAPQALALLHHQVHLRLRARAPEEQPGGGAERLAAADRANSAWQCVLAVSYYKLGALASQADRQDNARAELGHCATVLRCLVAKGMHLDLKAARVLAQLAQMGW